MFVTAGSMHRLKLTDAKVKTISGRFQDFSDDQGLLAYTNKNYRNPNGRNGADTWHQDVSSWILLSTTGMKEDVNRNGGFCRFK